MKYKVGDLVRFLEFRFRTRTNLLQFLPYRPTWYDLRDNHKGDLGIILQTFTRKESWGPESLKGFPKDCCNCYNFFHQKTGEYFLIYEDEIEKIE